MTRARTRLVVGGAAGLVAAALAAGGWLAWTANTARAELTAARADLAPLQSEVIDGSPKVAERITAVQRHAAAAKHATHDPVWAAAASVPWLGSPLATVRGLTSSVDVIAAQGLPALSAAATDVHPARVLDQGRIDVAGLATAAEPLGVATAVLQHERDAVGGLDASWLGPVAAARTDLHEQLVALSGLAASAHTAAQVAPGMLGGEGTRRYFVAFQNPAEVRGTGGLLDAFAIVRAERGGLVVERTGANTQLPALPAEIPGLDDTYLERYASQGATDVWVNSNLSPDFGEVGHAWVSMWQAATGQKLDGAVALDPYALSQVLSATGPVKAPVVGTVGADQIEDLVLLGQYQRKDLADQRKALMLGVGVQAMDAVLSGKANPTTLMPRLRTAAHAGHVLLYSTDDDEQNALRRSDLAGHVVQGPEPFAQAVLVNAGGNKLDTWLNQSLDYRVLECRSTGRTVAVTVKLLNAAPRKGLPQYVTVRSDKPAFPVVVGQNRIELQLLVTQGASLTSATLDGLPLPLAPPPGDLPATLPTGGLATGGLDSGLLDETVTAGRPSYGLDLELVPDVPRTLEVRFTEPAGLHGTPILPMQTLVEKPTVSADISACGSAS